MRQDIALAVHQAYYGHIAARVAHSIAGKNLTRAEDHLRLAKERFDAGAAPQLDVFRAQVEASDARLSLVKADNLVRISRGNLNTAMGLPSNCRGHCHAGRDSRGAGCIAASPGP